MTLFIYMYFFICLSSIEVRLTEMAEDSLETCQVGNINDTEQKETYG